MTQKLQPLITNEIRVVDDSGHTRFLVTAESGLPVMQLLQEDGVPSVSASLDSAGRGSVRLGNPNTAGPVAALEIDDKGAHIKFDRPGGASSYVFLNNGGESGLMLIDGKGKRRLNLLVQPDGNAILAAV